MRRSAFFVGPGLAALVVVASCGARTGLDAPFKEDARHEHEAGRHEAGLDATIHKVHDAAKDHGFDAPIPDDGHALDVVDECATPTYCKDGDPNYIYKCGERIFECGSLDQCEVRCGDAGTGDAGGNADGGDCHAECVNPCVDTLGQNTSNGCNFYAVEMDTTPNAVGVCYAVFIVNQWKTGLPAKLEVTLEGTTLPPLEQYARIPSGTGRDITYAPFPAGGLPQNEVAILFLSRKPANEIDALAEDPAKLADCPPGIVPAVVGDSALHGTGIGTAFHISSNVPVVAYQMLPYGGGRARVTGATLLLPTNVWGTNYLAANAYHYPSALLDPIIHNDAAIVAEELQRAGPSMVIVAQQDDTHITIDPVTNILPGPGVPPTLAGRPMTYTVDQGQYVQLTQPIELSGSAIQSDKPIAVIGGATLMDVPVGARRADHGEQMLPPVQALGNQYLGVRYRTRSPPIEEVTAWRMIGAVDGTVLTFDPPQKTGHCNLAADGGTIEACGAPSTLNAQEVVEFDATGPFVVTSQDASHPFYFAQYMTGGAPFGAGGGGMGDPEYVNVISPAQYLPRYTFFTDPTYPETNLVITRVRDAATGLFPDVTLDCAGLLGGWEPVGSSGTFEFTRFDLSTGDFKGQHGCDNGVHTISGSLESDAERTNPLFGVTIWGWGSFATLRVSEEAGESIDAETNPNYTKFVSYAYPAGANILKLNDVVLPASP